MNWSSGKDAAFALYEILQMEEYDVKYLLTTVQKKQQRVSMHGTSMKILEKQAECIGIPLRILSLPESVDMELYDDLMRKEWSAFKKEGIQTAVYGDILLEDLKAYRDGFLKQNGWRGMYPLWKKDTPKLAFKMIEEGIKAKICVIDASKLDVSFLGRDFDEKFLRDLPSEVDFCGENGEFHTLVYDGPMFQYPLNVAPGEIVRKSYSHNGKEYPFDFLDFMVTEQ